MNPLDLLITAIITASVEEAAPPTISRDGWTAIVGILTAIGGITSVLLLHARSRYAAMEREIRRLRAYSWENAKRLQKHNSWLEEVIESYRVHIDALEDQIWSSTPPPPVKMQRIPRPKEIDLISDLSIRETEEQTQAVLSEEKLNTEEA